MRITTLSSSFIFNFPSDFLPPLVASDYDGFLEDNHMPYENIIDYLNQSIKSVSFPGLSLTPNEQKILRGKVRAYKPATPVQDLVATHEINVTFKNIDGFANYFLLYDIFQKHYLDTEHMYINPFIITVLNPWRVATYQVRLYEIISISLSDTILDNSIQKINPLDFTMTFRFNFIELDFLLNRRKILDPGNKDVLGNSSPLILRK